MQSISIPLETITNGSALILTEINKAPKFKDGKRIEDEIDGYRIRLVMYQNNMTDIIVKVEKVSDDLLKINNEKISELNNSGKFVVVTVTNGSITPYVGRDGKQAYSVKADLISLAK